MKSIIINEGTITTLTITRPKALNALNKEVFDALGAFFNGKSLLDRGIRGVILTGSGEKAFAAGADIKEFMSLNEEQAQQLSERGQAIMRNIETADVPVIAAVNGFALGGGCARAMACHMIMASANAVFGQPEVKLGLTPGYAASQRLVERVGRNRAMEYLLTGNAISADEAYRMGLANVVVEQTELLPHCEKILNTIAKRGPNAVAHCIQLVDDYYNPTADGYENESRVFGECMVSDEAKEGINAFLEKRKPDFS